jgi:hypothetical protein
VRLFRPPAAGDKAGVALPLRLFRAPHRVPGEPPILFPLLPYPGARRSAAPAWSPAATGAMGRSRAGSLTQSPQPPWPVNVDRGPPVSLLGSNRPQCKKSPSSILNSRKSQNC